MRWTKRRSKPAPDAAALGAAHAGAGAAASGALNGDVPAPDRHRNAFILMGLGGGTVVIFGIAAISGIFAPVFLAFVLTICVHPLRLWLERRGVPRGLATGSVILAVTLLLVVLGYAILVAIGQFGSLLTEYSSQIADFGKSIATWLGSIGIDSDELHAMSADFDPSTLLGFLGGLVGGITGWISGLVIIFTMLLLMAMDAAFLPHLHRQLQPVRPLIVSGFVNYGDNVRRYMIVTTVLGLVQGFVDFIALVILQVPGAFIWGLLAFICSFIPNIGYFLALVPPIVFGGLVGGWPTVIAVIVVYGVINAVIQSVIQPRVVGKAVSLSQTITFFSVLFWAVVIGPIGAVLAIPLSLLLRLLLVDSNPSMAWIRPMIGELDETKQIMAESDAESKAARQARKAAKAASHSA
ncbi:AI-2E family transporter [Agromyces sp. NPDC055520]